MAGRKKSIETAMVVKSNQLVEARYRLTLREQRLILYMISTIKPDDEDFKPYRISVLDFARIMDIVGNGAYKAVKAITKGLIEKVLEIKTPTGLLQIAWLSSAEYVDKEGYVELCFDPKLKPYLLHLKASFTSYKLEYVFRLNSTYSIRIYQLLKQYHSIGKRTFKVEDLRKMLGINATEYADYNNFKKRVILTAQAELAEQTDLSFTFKETKTGRKVTGIEFTITVKAPEPTEAMAPQTEPINVTPAKEPSAEAAATTQPEPPDIASMIDLLPPEHRGKKTIMNAITAAYKEHGKEYAAYNIRYANDNCKDKGKYRVYLNKALKENWAEGLKEDMEAAKRQAAGKKLEAKKKEAAGRHDKELYDRAIEYIAKLKAKERKKLEAEALASFTPDMQAKYKAGVYYAVTGVKKVMEGIIMERLAGQGVGG